MSPLEVLRFMVSKSAGDVKIYLDGELKLFEDSGINTLQNIWKELKGVQDTFGKVFGVKS